MLGTRGSARKGCTSPNRSTARARLPGPLSRRWTPGKRYGEYSHHRDGRSVPLSRRVESIMVFNPPEAEADRSRKRPWRAPTRTASKEQIHIPWPFKLCGTGAYANVLTDFSRSHWRVFDAAINAPVSLASTTPASCPTFAIFKSAWPPLSTAMALR